MLLAAAVVLALQNPPRYERRRDHDPDGTGIFYMGREIAQFMSHEGADWLDRPERESEEGLKRLIGSLGLKPGMVAGDIGAGSGTLTLPMARLVGSTGRVYAVDIQREMLTMLARKAKQAKIANVVPVLGATDDPKLPAGSCDLLLLVDSYHEFDKPYEMVRGMVKGLKKGGRLVLVEYRKEDPRVPIKELHKMSAAQVRKEMAIFPLKALKPIESLPRQHVLMFEKI